MANDLLSTDIYFDRIHPSLPMLHRARHLAAMDLSPQQRPPIALRYAMWTLAASVSRKYLNLQEHFYLRARKYTEQAELTGHGEKVVSVAHTQTWILIGVYEFKMMHFPRTWLSIGRAARLAQMMGMHRVDCGPNVEMKQTLNPPRDWIETEERRRTFWMAFCIDRYGTVGTGWPMIIDEQDVRTLPPNFCGVLLICVQITTNLPCTEEDFEQGIVTQSISLDQAMTDPSSTSNLSSLAGVIVTATLFGRLLVHLHRPSADDAEDDPNGEYWTRHRHLDNTLLNTSLHLPTHLRLPAVSPSPNVSFFLWIDLIPEQTGCVEATFGRLEFRAGVSSSPLASLDVIFKKTNLLSDSSVYDVSLFSGHPFFYNTCILLLTKWKRRQSFST